MKSFFDLFFLGGNGGFLGFRIPKNPVKIPGVQWESQEYDGNPGSTMGIPGVQWKSREYDGNPGSTMGILGVHWESWEYNKNPKSTVAIRYASLPINCVPVLLRYPVPLGDPVPLGPSTTGYMLN